MKNIIKTKLFLSGFSIVFFLSIFYFYQYLTVFQLNDNPSENKKYIKFSQSLGRLLNDSHVQNYEKRIIQGDFEKISKKFKSLLDAMNKIELSAVEGTDKVEKKLTNIVEETDLEEYLAQMKKEKKELLKKTVSFLKLSEKNNWPTLVKISNNVVQKVSKLDLNSRVKDLNTDQNGISKDVNYMERITNVSSIDQKSKVIIKDRLESINESLIAYQKTLGPLSILNEQMTSLITLLTNWNKEIEAKAAGNLIVIENKELQIRNAKWTFIAFIIVCSLCLFIFSFMAENKRKEDIANEVSRVLKDGLFSQKPTSFLEAYGDEFNENIQKYRAYLNKRSSFGSLFQETIPLAVSVFKDDFQLHWSNKDFRNLNLDVNTFGDLLKKIDVPRELFDGQAKGTASKRVEFSSGSYSIFVKKALVMDETFFVFYAIPVETELENSENDEFKAFVQEIEDEKLISSGVNTEDVTPRIMIDAIRARLEMLSNQNPLQAQLEELENQVFDYHKINNDIGSYCHDIRDVHESLIERNNKISKNLLKIINSKESVERENEINAQRISELKNFNEKLLSSVETVVKEIFEIRNLAEKNDLSFGQIKQELESIYKFLASIEIPESLEIGEFANSTEEVEGDSLESEIEVAELLNDHFRNIDSLVKKLSSINDMISDMPNERNIREENSSSSEVVV